MDLSDPVTQSNHVNQGTHTLERTHPEHTAHPVQRAPKRLPRKAQITILGVIAAAVIGGFVVGPQALHLASGSQPTEQSLEVQPATDAQSFKPTAQQWAGLKIVPVREHVFQDAHNTDGKIAIDDDLETPVFSPYSGRVVKLFARAGDEVKRGDPLFSIQGSELAQAENDLITAASNLKTTKAQFALAQTNEKRQHELFLAQGAALKDWQQSQVDLATAQGNLNGASIALAAVRNRLRILGTSDHDIDTIETTSNLLQLNAETVVAAPISGTVVQRQIGLGQNIVSASAGASTPVFMIGDLSKVWLVAYAREEDAPLLHKGDPVEVSVLAFPGKVFNARLAYVAPSIDPNTHRLLVRAEVENPNHELKPEMFARFRIITGKDDAEPGVPEKAVVYEGDTAHVWLANPATKTLAIRPITAGRDHDGMIEVASGLKPGDSVVTNGAVFIDRAVAGD